MKVLLPLCLTLASLFSAMLPVRADDGGDIILEQGLEYGLGIVTYPSPGEEFTGLALEGGKPITLNNKVFGMEFDLYNRPENVFGCIFRIITDKGDNIDLMYTADLDGFRHPILVTGPQVQGIRKEIPMGEWMHVAISLDPGDGTVRLDYGGEVLAIRDAGTKGAKSFRISFGLCTFPGYMLVDVASVDLRDITISKGGKPFRRWPLARHGDGFCRDDLAGAPATVQNPRWLVDSYVTFKPVKSFHFDTPPSVSFDDREAFYFASGDSPVMVFHALSGEVETYPVRGGHNPAIYPNQLLYVSGHHNWLTAYNLDEGLFSTFDFGSGRWDSDTVPTEEHDFWNNTNSWEPREHAIFSFGGYGHYHYRNDLIVSYKDSPEKNMRMVLDDITPRYSSTSCIVDSLFYIFGGRGNPSGKQELSPQNYYDLYSLDTRTFTLTKLWDMGPSPFGDFVSGENFVHNWENGDFYLLSNLDGFTLLRLRPDSPGVEKMSLPIPPKRSAQYTYCNIWQSWGGGKLYALILQSQVDSQTDVEIYEMMFPPVPVSVVLQEDRSGQIPKVPDGVWWQLTAVVSALVAAFVIARSLRLQKKARGNASGRTVEVLEDEDEIPQKYDFSKSSVCFFGGFKVNDAAGRDISSQFTPTLKALLILLVLNTEKSGGISSQKINHQLWSYKMDDTANNNRNVYMSKLRGLLEEVGDARILNANKLWSVEFGKGAICDYSEACRLLSEGAGADVDALLELLLKGPLLPNTELDWVDGFKSTFSNTTIDFLSRQLRRDDLPEKTRLQAANTIFLHDFLNEDALRAMVHILCKQNKPGLAKTIYDSFCKEYRSSLGIPYSVSFKDLI